MAGQLLELDYVVHVCMHVRNLPPPMTLAGVLSVLRAATGTGVRASPSICVEKLQPIDHPSRAAAGLKDRQLHQAPGV